MGRPRREQCTSDGAARRDGGGTRKCDTGISLKEREATVEADERIGLFVGRFGKVTRAPGMSGRDMVSDSGEGQVYDK